MPRAEIRASAIDVLRRLMANQRDDLVMRCAVYRDRMHRFSQSNPGLSLRIAHHLEFPDYAGGELQQIAEIMLAQRHYRLSPSGSEAWQEYTPLRMTQPQFADTRSSRVFS
jgi:hypothetical protein